MRRTSAIRVRSGNRLRDRAAHWQRNRGGDGDVLWIEFNAAHSISIAATRAKTKCIAEKHYVLVAYRWRAVLWESSVLVRDQETQSGFSGPPPTEDVAREEPRCTADSATLTNRRNVSFSVEIFSSRFTRCYSRSVRSLIAFERKQTNEIITSE